MPFSERAAPQRAQVFSAIDCLFLAHKGELIIYYTHRPPVSITGADAWAMYLWLQSGSKLEYSEFSKAVLHEFEGTCPGKKVA